MFRKWLEENKIENIDFSGSLFPKAKDRDFWNSFCGDDVIKEAEKYLNYKWPVMLASDFIAFYKTGSRVQQEKPHYDRRNALFALLMGEVIEYKKRFLPDIVDGIFLICEETYWGFSTHNQGYRHKTMLIPDANDPYIDLFAAETAASLSVAYYLLYDELREYCPDILTRIETEIERRIISPYLKHMDWYWLGYYDRVSNWNPWILSNILMVFLLIQKNPVVFRDGLTKLFWEINNYYTSMPEDGGCDEGAMYWGVAGGKLFLFCEMLYLATNGKINFYDDEKLKKIARYEYYVYIGNSYFSNFADSGIHVSAELRYIAYMFGKRINDEKLQALSGEIPFERIKTTTNFAIGIFNFIYEKEMLKEKNYVPEEICVLPVLQTSFIRNDKWYYASKGGFNAESHNHNDVGSFLVYYDNNPLLVDPGCGTYTRNTFLAEERYKIWTMKSSWHNLPTINKAVQVYGLKYVADSFEVRGKETLISFKDAYSEDAGLESLKRSILVNDEGITLKDSFEFTNSENEVIENFVTPLPLRLEDNKVIINEEFILECSKDAEILFDSVSFEGDKKLIDMWKTEGMNRIRFKFNTEKNEQLQFVLRRK